MPGYSGTPLPKKLGIRPGYQTYLVNVPAEVRAELRGARIQCNVARGPRYSLDFVMLFSKSRRELGEQFARTTPFLAPAGMLWVGWPKKTSEMRGDLDEYGVREIGLGSGLVDVKVCAITEIWSGLKFVRRLRDRRSPS
jgi:hypothetical protein